MFFANYDALASKFDRVIAVDWLGMGGSSRPSCYNSPRMPIFGNWLGFQPMDPTKATNFFIDSLEVFVVNVTIPVVYDLSLCW
jgi:pimeloyl-ACP methyl ester carboxylesterase